MNTYGLGDVIVIGRAIDKVRAARRLQVFHVAVDSGRDVRHAVHQRASGDLSWLLAETVADVNETSGRRLSRTHRLVSRLVVNVWGSMRGIMQRVGGRMVPDVFQLDLLADVLRLGRLSDGRPSCK